MSDRRQVPRYIAEFPGQVSQPPGALPRTVSVLNISVSGCSVGDAANLKAGQECEVVFQRKDLRFRAKAQVSWKNSQGEAGLRLLDVSPTQQEILRRICATLHLQPLVHREEE